MQHTVPVTKLSVIELRHDGALWLAESIAAVFARPGAFSTGRFVLRQPASQRSVHSSSTRTQATRHEQQYTGPPNTQLTQEELKGSVRKVGGRKK